jgi:hypothetical protein
MESCDQSVGGLIEVVSKKQSATSNRGRWFINQSQKDSLVRRHFPAFSSKRIACREIREELEKYGI